MPRRDRDDDQDDDEDDRPRRRRRAIRDDDDRPAPRSNTGLILAIIGGVVLVVLVGCGVFGYFAFSKMKTAVEESMAQEQAYYAMENFLSFLQAQQPQVAYDSTSAGYKSRVSKAEFDELLKKQPILTKHKHAVPMRFGNTPTGTRPNRQFQQDFSLSLTANDMMSEDDEDLFDEDNPAPKPKPPVLPKKDKAAEKPVEPVKVTIVTVEEADGTWKVDSVLVK